MNLDELKKIYHEASNAVLQAYQEKEVQGGLDATPDQLDDAIEQFFAIAEKLENQPSPKVFLNRENISLIGEQTINCLADLAWWAEHLSMPNIASMLEEIALSVTHWIILQRGEIRSMEAIVNILVDKVKKITETKTLTSLFYVISDVIDHAPQELKEDKDKADPNRPWRTLIFNYAIVATRTNDSELITRAFDTLGKHLPQDCPEFFEEGLRQSDRPVYNDETRILVADYFHKWNIVH